MTHTHELVFVIPPIVQHHVTTDTRSSPPLTIRERYDRPYLDDVDDEEGEKDYQDIVFYAIDESDTFLGIELKESFEMLANSFSPENVSLDGHNYSNFGNDTSNTYFEQDFKMYLNEG